MKVGCSVKAFSLRNLAPHQILVMNISSKKVVEEIKEEKREGSKDEKRV